MRSSADIPRRVPRTSRRFRIGVLIAIVALIIVLSTIRALARFYTSYLWFQEVHFTSVFRGVLVTKVLLAVVFCAVFFVVMLASLTVADHFAPKTVDESARDELVERYREVVSPYGRWVRIVTALVFCLFAGIGTNGQWNHWVLFRDRVNFGVKDPVFHKDIAFYVFDLPFIRFLLGWGFGAVVVVLLVTGVACYLNGGIRFQGSSPRVTATVKTHLSVLLGVLALIRAVSYYFDRFQLVLSTGGVVDGATKTSLAAKLPADDLLVAIAVIAAALFLVNTRVRGWTLPAVAVIVWAVVWIVVGNIYPALYQRLRVEPSELAQERLYIQRNIDATRAAYGINDVKVVKGFNSTADQSVPTSAIEGNSAEAQTDRETIANAQLLDPTQLVNTFENLQAIRSFYSIDSLSVNRYKLDLDGQDTLTETLTGVRELNTSIPGGFTNTHLEYTHGYGAVVSPANEAGVADNGYPKFTLDDIPPSGEPLLNSKGAQVYYGEGSQANGYVIADSKQPELDYEDASGNEVTGHYKGSGGVRVDNLFRRLAFSLSFGDLNILLSGQVTDNSRVIYERNIIQRVKKAAPFLAYDSDPYAVALDGQLYWVVDGYTKTANYPYSQDAVTTRVPSSSGLSGRFNYVRNSVKVVINAYTGKMDFFVVDPSDPIIEAYEKAFPDLFIPGSKADSLIPGITSHFRYPEDLFEIQTNMYGRYHLTNVSAFYTEANAWNISQDPGSGRPGTSTTQTSVSATGLVTFSVKELDPEYEVAALPGQHTQEFLITQPFVPVSSQSSRKNLTAVMFASSDPDDYGDLTVYETPPGEYVVGPALVTSEINANPSISSELSLLNQQGSEVKLGEVVTVPIDNTLMYVQPVYVESSTNQVPQLKDVIVVYDGQAYHSANASLDGALCQIGAPFTSYCSTAAAQRPKLSISENGGSSTTRTTPTTVPTTPSTATSQSVDQLLTDAENEFSAATAALDAGDLGRYQSDVNLARADVARAKTEEAAAAKSTPTTTTTVPKKATPTTTAPAGTG